MDYYAVVIVVEADDETNARDIAADLPAEFIGKPVFVEPVDGSFEHLDTWETAEEFAELEGRVSNLEDAVVKLSRAARGLSAA